MQRIVSEVMEDSLEQFGNRMLCILIVLILSLGRVWGDLPLQIFRVDQTSEKRDIRAEGRFKALMGLHQISAIITLH